MQNAVDGFPEALKLEAGVGRGGQLHRCEGATTGKQAYGEKVRVRRKVITVKKNGTRYGRY